jgi:hypothetical protein
MAVYWTLPANESSNPGPVSALPLAVSKPLHQVTNDRNHTPAADLALPGLGESHEGYPEGQIRGANSPHPTIERRRIGVGDEMPEDQKHCNYYISWSW